MCPADISEQQHAEAQGSPPIQCDACEAALQSATSQTVSFLLLDQLTVPVVGCEAHLERFATACGFTTDGTASLIEHRPAGGISCPSCQLTLTNPQQPLIPVQDGAVAPLACAEHQTELIGRFHTGLDTAQQLTASLDTVE
ncbi:hypothetical protein [Haloglomus halophilum]|jgi:hypothetical protein|nr:hypothetical protein [Haloglomus halophilum]